MTRSSLAWFLLALPLLACGGTKSSSDGGTSGGGTTGGDAGSTTGTAPAPSGVLPGSGPTDGGTNVTVTGTGFATGATVKLGASTLTEVVVVSPTEIHGVTAPAAAGSVDLIVVNPDSKIGTKKNAFTFVAPQAGPTIGWCNLQFPQDTTGVAGTPLDLYGRVYVKGVTDQAGQGAGVALQAGITQEDGGLSWLDATYNVDTDSADGAGDHANDEYVVHTAYPATAGSYLSAFRAQVGGGAYTYCEKDGPHAQFDPTQAGTVTATVPQPATIGWCNLQFPLQANVAPGDVFSLYGRVYALGITDQVGPGAGITMEAGLGYDDGGWSWNGAVYNADADSQPNAGDHANDEYQWSATGPAPGTYATAFRAKLGTGDWSYCESDGIHATLDPNFTGTLTSAVPPPPKVTWCNLQFPAQATGTPGGSTPIFGQVFQAGLTDQGGQGAGIVMELGLGYADGGWDWQPTSYDADQGNNDEYEWQGPNPGAGSYLTAFRASLDNGPWTYCLTDGPYDQIDVTKAGTLDVSAAAPPKVGWCNLQFPLEQQASPGQTVSYYGRVFAQGITDQSGAGAGIAMQFGLGYDDGGWSWTTASYFADRDGLNPGDNANDEYQLDVAAPGQNGNYATAFRASLDGGPWTYCEQDGPHDALDPLHAGPLTVGPTVGFCDLHFPTQFTAAPSDPVDFYGWVYQQGVTDQQGQGTGIVMELGLGYADGGWSWQPATYNADKDGLNPGDHANDEYRSTLTAPGAGTYLTAYRAALTGGPWLYCEPNGPHLGIDPSDAGTLVVQ